MLQRKNRELILDLRLAHIICAGLFSLTLSLPFGTVSAEEPYIPESDDTVLTVLPRSLLVDRNAVRQLRQQLAADPQNLNLAVTVANRYLSIGKRDGDPRFFGYARSAISPWWDANDAAPQVLKLRAKLKENDHQFEAAAADLKLALLQKPNDPQLLLELANIYRVQGKFDAALLIGDQLEQSSGPVTAALCRAPIFVLTGRVREAEQILDEIKPAAEESFPSTLTWISAVQGDIALALGKNAKVESRFLKGLERNGDEVQLLRRYGDFLLDHERNKEALDLLRDHIGDNGVLLRAAIAAKRCDNPAAEQWSRQLETRFNEIRMRGSEPHGRFESRFALHVQNDPDRALKLAAKNWERQKEVRDVRNFLEASIAVADPESASPVLEFLEQNNTKHSLLDSLVDQVRSLQ